MKTVVFDGEKMALEREKKLKSRIATLNLRPRMLSIVFDEDEASLLYTRLKFEVAQRVGIEFDRQDYSMLTDVPLVQEQIRVAGKRADIHGVMVQKPAKRVWQEITGRKGLNVFDVWWKQLVSQIRIEDDVDCLSPPALAAVLTGNWKLVPATVKAILLTLEHAFRFDAGVLSTCGGGQPLQGKRVSVIGRSDLVGKPLAAVLRQKGAYVDLLGSQTEDLGYFTTQADIIVSATGRRHIVREDLVSEGVVVVDVGAPYEEVDFEWVQRDASFITPVPNGVGPMTVISLLENLVEIVIEQQSIAKQRSYL